MSKSAHGILLAATGASLWGGSGAAAQYLFSDTPVTTTWLVTVRMLGAGLLLTLYSLYKHPDQFRQLFANRRHLAHLAGFAICGTMASQLTYFMAIKYSNAPTATVIQYLQPVLIILWVALRSRKWPRRIDNISVVLALAGTFLLTTGGHLGKLVLTPQALVWGLAAAVAAAVYTLLPRELLRTYDTMLVCGLAMLLGGIILSPELIRTPLPHLTGGDWLMVGYVVIFGTMLAYTLFLGSLNYINPTTTGILGAFEPLIATVLAVLLLGTKLTHALVIGSLLILATTFLQAIPVKKNPLTKG